MPKETFEAKKLSIRKLLENFFEIPSFQRGYVWETDQASDLFDDTFFAFENKIDSEYFLGSLVLQRSFRTSEDEINYEEFIVLDGQQRLTTLLMLISAFKNKFSIGDYKSACDELLSRKRNLAKKIPEKTRLTFKIRDKVQEYIKSRFIEGDGNESITVPDNNSAKNLTNVYQYFIERIKNIDEETVKEFFGFIMDNVQVVYVATEKFEDAFRLFTILNNRGMPLSPSDILKSENLGLILDERVQDAKARDWESIESQLGKDDFEKLIFYIRTIILKEKAREDILTEFREKIFKTKIVQKGDPFIVLTFKYAEIYKRIIANSQQESEFSPKQFSLLELFRRTFPSSDWIPPLMMYINKFGGTKLEEFTKKLLAKNASDFILGKSPTERITNNLNILKEISKVTDGSLDTLINNSIIFDCDKHSLKVAFEGDIYHTRYAKLVMLLNEYLLSTLPAEFIPISYPATLSLEHICPQIISSEASWLQVFNENDHKNCLHKAGNLIVISRKKNSSLSNKAFSEKKAKYFAGSISNFPDANSVMSKSEWGPIFVKDRTSQIVNRLLTFFD